MEPPVLRWQRSEWHANMPLMPGPTQTLPYYGREGWYLVNDNPRPIMLESLRITARYKRWIGGIVEQTWELTDLHLRAGQEIQVRQRRPPLFSTLLSHSLTISATYGRLRYKLTSYRTPNLFAVPSRPLILRLYDRDFS